MTAAKPLGGILRPSNNDDDATIVDADGGAHSVFGLGNDIVAAVVRRIALTGNSTDTHRHDSDDDAPDQLLHRSLSNLSAMAWCGRAIATASCDEALQTAILGCRTDDRYRVLVLDRARHGGSFAGRSAGGDPRPRTDMGPKLPGFVHLDSDAVDPATAIAAAIDDATAAILLPVILPAGDRLLIRDDWLIAAESAARQHSLALIIDHSLLPLGCDRRWIDTPPVAPDMMLLSAGLFAGIPGGVLLTTETLSPSNLPPVRSLQSAVAAETLRAMADQDVLTDTATDDGPVGDAVGNAGDDPDGDSGDFARSVAPQVAKTLAEHDLLRDIAVTRGCIALTLNLAADEFVDRCRRRHLVLTAIDDDVVLLRLPLVGTEGHDRLVSRLGELANDFAAV